MKILIVCYVNIVIVMVLSKGLQEEKPDNLALLLLILGEKIINLGGGEIPVINSAGHTSFSCSIFSGSVWWGASSSRLQMWASKLTISGVELVGGANRVR